MTEPTIDSTTYVEQTAVLMQLPIPPAYQSGVVENFERITTIAQLFLEFPLPEETETAPVFEP